MESGGSYSTHLSVPENSDSFFQRKPSVSEIPVKIKRNIFWNVYYIDIYGENFSYMNNALSLFQFIDSLNYPELEMERR